MNEYPILKTAQKVENMIHILHYAGKHQVFPYQKGRRGHMIKDVAPSSHIKKCGPSDRLWFQELCVVLVSNKKEAKALAKVDLDEYKEYGGLANVLSCYASHGDLYSQIPFDGALQPTVVYIPIDSKKSMKLLKELRIYSMVISEHIISKKQCSKLVRKYKDRIHLICVPHGYPTK